MIKVFAVVFNDQDWCFLLVSEWWRNLPLHKLLYNQLSEDLHHTSCEIWIINPKYTHTHSNSYSMAIIALLRYGFELYFFDRQSKSGLSCQIPFVRGPEDFSEDLQLTELPSQLAEPALLVKLEHMKKCEIADPIVHVTQRQLKPSLGGAKSQKTRKSSHYENRMYNQEEFVQEQYVRQ